MGVNPDAVFAVTGLDRASFGDPENGVSFRAAGKLLEACCLQTGCPQFGFLLGLRAATGHFGVVGTVMNTAATLGDALQALCINQPRYIRGAVAYLATHDDLAFWGYSLQGAPIPGLSAIYDCAIGVGFALMRELTGNSPADCMLMRAAEPGEDVESWIQSCGVRPVFNSRQNAVRFPASLLQTPCRSADPARHKSALALVRRYWMTQQPDIAEQVGRVLQARVLAGETTRASVARELGIAVRTMNRRLAQEGTSFRDQLSTARFSVAQQLLSGTGMAIGDIAHALDYSDTAAFTRAFQKWSQLSPMAWRVKYTRSGTRRTD